VNVRDKVACDFPRYLARWSGIGPSRSPPEISRQFRPRQILSIAVKSTVGHFPVTSPLTPSSIRGEIVCSLRFLMKKGSLARSRAGVMGLFSRLSRLESALAVVTRMPPEPRRLKSALNIAGCLALLHAIHSTRYTLHQAPEDAAAEDLNLRVRSMAEILRAIPEPCKASRG
jgi:hypothetical protein